VNKFAPSVAAIKIIKLITPLLIILLVVLKAPLASAQTPEVDESFDPFADYNEFEQQTEEEADINFLRNGRYLTLAFVTGFRGFLGGGFAQAYKGSLHYGAEFNYFFDMQLSGGLAYLVSDHSVDFASYNADGSVSTAYSGNVNIQVVDFHMKYYFNSDNVTKGLADLNPYSLVGTGYYARTYSLNQSLAADPDRVVGFKIGGGLEIPLMRRQAYLGLQGTYRYVQFPDENKSFIDEAAGDPLGFRPIKPKLDGDIYEISLMLGLNF
jgi:hypothetical protein